MQKNSRIAAVILAAGEGKRMHSDLPKVCHLLAGEALVRYPVRACQALHPAHLIVVVSGRPERAAIVKAALALLPANRAIDYAEQNKPLGTADAAASALNVLNGFKGTIVILNGDMPLLKSETLQRFLQEHEKARAQLSLVTTYLERPFGYGRILRRDGQGDLIRIVEERDATFEERKINEVNVGIYAVDAAFFAAGIKEIGRDNKQHEYYLTDLLGVALEQKLKVRAHVAKDHREFLGINTQKELVEVEALMKLQKIETLLEKGVRILDPASTFVGPEVEIAAGATLYPGCTLMGQSKIGRAAEVGPYVYLEDTTVGEKARIKPFSVLEGAVIGVEASVGPFSHLRPGSELKAKSKVGNFVELKKTILGIEAKANHLAYLGDTKVGARANIGAGTITCNYDGYEKFETEIGEEAFIGSDTQLVAPVKVGKGAVVGAGTTVTTDVPAGALALSRSPQVNKKDWAKRKKAVMAKRLAHSPKTKKP